MPVRRDIILITFRLILDENPLTHLFWVKRVIQLPTEKRSKTDDTNKINEREDKKEFRR